MSGRKNLIPMNERTAEEKSKIARMGGIASGEARREKRKTLDMLEMLLEQKIKTEDGRMSREQAYMLSVLNRGIRYGSTDLLELLAKLRGELVQKSEVDFNGQLPVVLTDIVEDDETPTATETM